MSEENKKLTLEFITGQLVEEGPYNFPSFEKSYAVPNNLNTKIIELGYDDFDVKSYVENPNSDKLVVFGEYQEKVDSITQYYGLIIVLNGNFQILKICDSYDSGTKLRPFYALKTDEDGYYYGLDTDYNKIEYNYRFIMLNNFVEDNNYSIRLRYSYNIPSEYKKINLDVYSNNCLKKAINSSTYCFFGSENNEYANLLILKINVGTENEWLSYTSTEQLQLMGYDYIFSVSNDIINFKAFFGNAMNEAYFAEMILSNDTLVIFNKNYIIDGSVMDTFKIINEDLCYMSAFKQGISVPNSTVNYVYKYENEILKEIFRSDEIFWLNNYFSLQVKNGMAFFIQNSYIDKNTSNVHFCGISGNSYFESIIPNLSNNLLTFESFFITNKYNLFQCTLQYDDNVYIVPLIYNPLNYNGKAYDYGDSLLSHSAILYSENKPVFARNLYNRAINNNVGISTFEIPNILINDYAITSNVLFSKNNNLLIYNNKTIEKNKYETVYLNFINTIKIINDNFERIENIDASVFFNEKINDVNLVPYYSVKLYDKVIITYQDCTEREISFDVKRLNDTSANIIFSIFTNKKISNARFISNTDGIVYLTIDLSLLEIKKLYTIKQKVEVL